ncbi:unnamed protein product [Mytilus edulis]|uniref:Retrotransposon gag domain-containing protein n=1 Tax=Mytilus edulis TaxID=6550 RepID=A0A8S3VBK1_MYTED|nr:unnamed protein product [Mytilus edulis]
MPYRNTAGAKSTTGATLSIYNTRVKAQAAEDIYSTDLEEVLVNITEQQPGDDQTEIVNITEQEPVANNQINLQNRYILHIIQIAHFHDETCQVPAIWWTMFENYIKLQNYQNEAALAAFSFHVEGQASTWYHSLPTATRDDLTNLKAAFLDRFKHHNTNNELYRLKQHPHETGIQYLTRVQNLASGAQNISEQTIVGLCKNGLNPDIKPFVVGKDPKTINELREAIYLATSVAECKASDVNTNNTNISTQNVQKSNVESVNNVHSINDLCSSLVEGIRSVFQEQVMAVGVPHGDQNRQNYSQNYRGSRQQSLTKCKFCGKSHVFDRRKCPAYNVECFYCHKFGHFKEVCDKKELDERKANSQNWQPRQQSNSQNWQPRQQSNSQNWPPRQQSNYRIGH